MEIGYQPAVDQSDYLESAAAMNGTEISYEMSGSCKTSCKSCGGGCYGCKGSKGADISSEGETSTLAKIIESTLKIK